MKKIFIAATLFPGLVFGQSYKCKLGQNETVKIKINDKSSLTAEIYQGKKLITNCLFNSRFPASDPRGVASEIIQNYENAGCSKVESGSKNKYLVSSKIYTKIAHDKKRAYLFLLTDHQPLECEVL